MAEFSKYVVSDGTVLDVKDATARTHIADGDLHVTAALKNSWNGAVSDVATLKGSGTGSISKMISDEIAAVVANAPTDFDTLKEISDWISTHSESASEMNSAI